jgi:Zn-dependent peptidase ImmA (M78 family)/DNA-binding XRE family transcriptional regulator
MIPEQDIDAKAFEGINARQIGLLIKRMRNRTDFKQVDVAQWMQVPQNTLVEIESGARKVKLIEMLKLAKIYCRSSSVSFCLKKHKPEYRLIEQFSDVAKHKSLVKAINRLEDLSKGYMEMERIVRENPFRELPDDRVSLDGDGSLYEQIETITYTARASLNLEDDAVEDIGAALEEQLGIRIFFIKMPKKIFSVYCYDDILGVCIAINSLYNHYSRRWHLAQTYFHYLTNSKQPLIQTKNDKISEIFASCFLMPLQSIKTNFNQIVGSSRSLTVQKISQLAMYYGVCPKLLILRLEMIGLLPLGYWKSFTESDFAHSQLIWVPGKELSPDLVPINSSRCRFLATLALAEGRISGYEFLKYLHLSETEKKYLLMDF